jgi:hypothetical protein
MASLLPRRLCVWEKKKLCLAGGHVGSGCQLPGKVLDVSQHNTPEAAGLRESVVIVKNAATA